MIFLEGFLIAKKLTIALRNGFDFFLEGCFSNSPFNGLFTSSSNIFALIKWFAFIFFSMLLFELLYYIC